MAKKKIELVDNQDRSVLSEGRSSGIGFAMLKKVNENTYETVNPISPCKDYLAEVIFTEHTGMPTSAHGLNYKKVHKIFEKPVSYLLIKNMGTKGGSFSVEGKTFEIYSEEIKKGYKNIENFINKFQQGFKNYIPCKIEPVDDTYIVSFDTRWAASTFSISLLALLIRVGKSYETGDVDLYLDSIPNTNIDYSLMRTARKNTNIILNEKKLPTIPEKHIKARKTSSSWNPHNYGICGWDGSFE